MPQGAKDTINRLKEKLGKGRGETSPFSLRVFMAGVGVVFLIYLCVFVWLALNAKTNIEIIQSDMASKTAAILHKTDNTPVMVIPPTEIPSQEVPAEQAFVPTTTEGPSVTAQPAAPVEIEEESIALAPAPLSDMLEKGPLGEELPIIRASDKLTPFGAYRRRFNLQAVTQPVISIAVADIGLSTKASEPFIKDFPPAVSIILSPYAAAPNMWVNESRAAGHEVWLSLPLEPEKFPQDDTGPLTLMLNAAERDNQLKLEQIMGSTIGYAGFVATYNEVFSKSDKDMRPVLTAIYKRGLGYIDSAPTAGLNTQTIALAEKAPYASVDIWIDDNSSPEDINKALVQLEEIARSKNRAVGVIPPLPATQKLVKDWLDTLPGKGFVLAPLSAQTGM